METINLFTLDANMIKILTTCIISFVLTVVAMPLVIPILHKFKFGQNIRVDGPQSHLSKQGTPTMGGIVFVITTFITMLLFRFDYLFSVPGILITVAFWGFFLIGFLDDALIIIKKQSEGLSPKIKLLLQVLVTGTLMIIYPDLFFSTKATTIVFFDMQFNLHFFYVIFALIMFVGYSNAINLTDGLDGLSSITVAIALLFMAIIAFVQSQMSEAIYIAALIGGLLGFYVFNRRPAKVFMGDTGSLALGGFYAVIALLLKVELLSIVIGFLFVIETISVVIQVLYFKKTKKKFFRMAPIHHHFELTSLQEQGTVIVFYIFSFLFGLLGMVLYFV